MNANDIINESRDTGCSTTSQMLQVEISPGFSSDPNTTSTLNFHQGANGGSCLCFLLFGPILTYLEITLVDPLPR
ncbi:hypothetical protein JAAARDRAFT_583135 [Jaapia argillacea MUCL 33604]|uniref:Uncharacterized protein n=1 Tax=Jaapia argillacea MUCL 33604 TaxID=933084 RepID=A0A067P6M8_9AGAM|nr:hypothetical protein JAAARDRAFT_583135 [Jaapia argillacea MUCL 33604]